MFPLDLSFSSLHVFCFVEKQFLLLLKIQSFFCTRLPESRPKYNLLLYPAVHHSLCYTLLYRRRALGFSVLRFWLIFGSVSLFLCKKKFGFFVLVFITVCGFIVFQHVVLGFREKYKRVFGFDIRCGFQFFLSKLFGFRFLFDLSGNYTPPMISNSR